MQTLNDGRVVVAAGETVPVFCPCGHPYQPAIDSDSSVCPRRACHRFNVHRLVELQAAVNITFEHYGKPTRDLPWDPAYIERLHPAMISAVHPNVVVKNLKNEELGKVKE